ncbi:MAG: response regulator [Pseudomonadota bacterium]|nr:MAG: response regulator [Pseudomonadota bacterium]
MSKETILIVEDNARNRKLLRDVLSHHGYQVLEANSGEEGLALATAQRPQLVMMDIQLPGIDGVETLRRLRDNGGTRAIPVMAVTASVMGQEVQRIHDAGFDDYLQKPVSLKDMLAAVERLLARTSSHSQL